GRHDQRIPVGRRHGEHIVLKLQQVDITAVAAPSIRGSAGVAQALLASAKAEELTRTGILRVRITVVAVISGGIGTSDRNEPVGGHDAGYALHAALPIAGIVSALSVRRIRRSGRRRGASGTAVILPALDRLEAIAQTVAA